MKKILAFSLVELMVTLIIISCIISAISPMITKKLKSQGITVGSGVSSNANLEFKQECSQFGLNCALCFSDRCAMCALECNIDEYLDTPNCKCASCSKYENCLECTSKQCTKCDVGYFSNMGVCEICPVGNICNGEYKEACKEGEYIDVQGATYCKTCVSKTQNCVKCNFKTGECLECEEKYELNSQNGSCIKKTKIPKSQEDCTPFNAIYFPAKYNGVDNLDLCVTRNDLGEDGGPPIYQNEYTKIVGLGSYCDNTYGYCCWTGNPVTCGYYAARESCRNWTINNSDIGTWDLPSKNITDGWISSFASSSEFQFLFYSQLDLPRSLGWTTNCPSGSGNACCYHVLWTTYFENSNAYTIHCNDSLGATIWGDIRAALVARCVAHELPNIE